MSAMELPPYSVLMSVYGKDKPQYLEDSIASMVSQSIPFEDMVIVCDGPLTDGLDEVLESWGRELGNSLTLVRLPKNVGLGAALAEGLSRCRCDIIVRMDSDDISRPDRCRTLLKKMKADGLDLVGGAIEEFNHEPGDMGAVRAVPLEENDIRKRLKQRNPFNHVTVAFDRKIVQAAGGYQPFPWMEDYWLWARMIARGCRCANVPDVVVDVRTGDGMYARRSNMAYLKSQARFFSELRSLGIVGSFDQVKAVAVRALATLLPTQIVKALYNGLLRRHV